MHGPIFGRRNRNFVRKSISVIGGLLITELDEFDYSFHLFLLYHRSFWHAIIVFTMTYDLAIIGGGPAGAAAAVYASRKRLKAVFVTKDWLGQSNVSEGIENWVGTVKVSGLELSQM